MNENITLYIGGLVVLGAGVIATEAIRQSVKRYFDRQKENESERVSLSKKIEKLMDKVDNLIEALKEHKEANSQQIQALSEGMNYKISMIGSRISDLDIREKEHYQEVKGKVDKQWSVISDMRIKQAEIIKTQESCDYSPLRKKQ
jgi:plasmid maintenance system killer protein